MKVIVTGGSGRLGGAVIKTLAQRGHEVINVDRRPAQREARFVYLDLRNRALLQPVMEQAEAIIHMGEIPNVRAATTLEEVYATNCAIGSMVFQLAAELNYRKVIYTSTIQVYGFADDGMVPPVTMPIDEQHPLRPRNAYGLAKAGNENYARLCSETSDLSVSVFRLPWIVMDDNADRTVGTLERDTPLRGDLGIYVKDDDVADCFALALEKPIPGFEAYNLAAREVIHTRPIREAMIATVPNFPRLPESWEPYQMPYLWEKAHRHFGWEPRWNARDIFRARFGRDPGTSARPAN